MNVTPAMQRLLASMTPQQINTAYHLARNPRPTARFSKSAVRAKGKKQHLVVAAAITKSTRPLNSWIAFRSYYSKIFESFQQKDISGFLTYMWQTDPFKAKWSILAKAYSVIRDDQGKSKAPLDEFLAMNGPLVGIIEPHDYLEALGWEIVVGGDGQIVMRRDHKVIDERLRSSNISVNDVVRYCHQQGYYTGLLSNVLLSGNDATLSMATSVQNPSNTQSAPGIVNTGHRTDIAMTTDSEGTAEEDDAEAMTDSSHDSTVPTSTENNEAEAEEEDIMVDNADDESGTTAVDETSASNETATITNPVLNIDGSSGSDASAVCTGGEHTNSNTTSAVANSTIANLPAERLSPSDFHLNGEYPFNAEFDPNAAGFTFDPFMGNQFDAFDMSDGWTEFFNFDAFN